MSLLLEQIAELVELTGVAARGSKLPEAPARLYLGRLPDTPVECVTLFEQPGEEAQYSLDGAAIEYPRVALWSRSARYPDSRARAETVYDFFLNVSNLNVAMPDGSLVRFLALRPLQPPFELGRDESDRAMVAFNLRIQRAT